MHEFRNIDHRVSRLSDNIAAIKAAEAQRAAEETARALQPSLVFIHAILRPDANGQWFIQNDVDHVPWNVHPDTKIQLIQDDQSLKLYFKKRFSKAGMIQVTTDDGFSGAIHASASLGLEVAGITLRASPKISPSAPAINPRHIWRYLKNQDNGNLWVSITMVDCPEKNPECLAVGHQ